jgi:repressor LexA
VRKKREAPTEAQVKVLEFITAYMKVKGYAPSYMNIAQGLGLKSKSNIHRLVHELRIRGLLKLNPYKVRSLKLDSSVNSIVKL